jgi:hypothetical protein
MKSLRSVICLVSIFLFAASCAPEITDQRNAEMIQSTFEKYQGTEWKGPAELWIDAMGNEAAISEAILRFEAERLSYTWSHDGEEQVGEIKITEDGILWQDSWHQPEIVRCAFINDPRGIFSVEYSYPAGSGPDWFWRIKLSQRPDESLVLQMTNITPWGEEGRAVRMVFSQRKSEL